MENAKLYLFLEEKVHLIAIQNVKLGRSLTEHITQMMK